MHTIWWIWTYAYTHDAITTIEVINISVTSKSFPVYLFVRVITEFNITSTLLRHFWVNNSVSLALDSVVQQISKPYLSFINETSCPLNDHPWAAVLQLFFFPNPPLIVLYTDVLCTAFVMCSFSSPCIMKLVVCSHGEENNNLQLLLGNLLAQKGGCQARWGSSPNFASGFPIDFFYFFFGSFAYLNVVFFFSCSRTFLRLSASFHGP